jgi:hypothetical protein
VIKQFQIKKSLQTFIFKEKSCDFKKKTEFTNLTETPSYVDEILPNSIEKLLAEM